MNTFTKIKQQYNLETNVKGIEYIETLEKEVERLNTINLIAIHLMSDKQVKKLISLTKEK